MEKESEILSRMEKRENSADGSFTIIWEIENPIFSNLSNKLYSPAIFVDVMEKTGWRLVLYQLPPNGWIYVTLKREAKDNGSKEFELHYDFDLTPNTEKVFKKNPRSHTFRNDEFGPSVLLCKCDFGNYSFEPILPHNITIKCIMRRKDVAVAMPDQCIARTRIEVEFFDIIGRVKNFIALPSGTKKTLKVLSLKGKGSMTVKLRLDNNNVVIETIPMFNKSECRYIFSCSILECSDNETSIKTRSVNTLQEAEELIIVKKTTLENNAEYYLPNGTLNVGCKIAIQTGITTNEPEYEINSHQSEKTVFRSSQKHHENFESAAGGSSTSFHLESVKTFPTSTSTESKQKDNLSYPFPNALDDFAAFYKKGILCDTKLQTDTETFPAHSVILSARSPVFEAMFASNMKEKIRESVRIDDLDTETVKRMLLFLYSDTLEELEWENAKKLYFAADKYQILSLKHRCAMILKKSIDLSNCCELLILADLHQDEDLKAAVQDYIAKDNKKVFLSDQWRNLEKSHPHLAIEIFHTCIERFSP